jgi:hypothetical protein
MGKSTHSLQALPMYALVKLTLTCIDLQLTHCPLKPVLTSPTPLHHNELTTSVDWSISCKGVLARLYSTKFKGNIHSLECFLCQTHARQNHRLIKLANRPWTSTMLPAERSLYQPNQWQTHTNWGRLTKWPSHHFPIRLTALKKTSNCITQVFSCEQMPLASVTLCCTLTAPPDTHPQRKHTLTLNQLLLSQQLLVVNAYCIWSALLVNVWQQRNQVQ